MKQICKYLGYATLILGILGSLVLAFREGMLNFIFGVFTTAVPASILLGISKILEELENLKGNSGTPEQDTDLTRLEEERERTYWKCPQCGKSNPPYAGTCGCGCEKP